MAGLPSWGVVVKFRLFLVGLTAVIIFFTIFEIADRCAFALVLLVNDLTNPGRTGLSGWVLPLWARGIGSLIGASAGIAVNNKIFKDYPRRPVAITIFMLLGVGFLIVLLHLMISDQDESERKEDLFFIFDAAICALTVWKQLWPGAKIRN